MIDRLLRATRGFRTNARVAIALLVLVAGHAPAQDGTAWEMRVCAPPASSPMSSRTAGGFDNDVAEILADQLNAHVTYEWTRLDRESLQRTLMAGDCDVAVGLAEGAAGVLNTVPYLRAPYVFVSRADRELEVESLDDDALAALSIGTYPGGVPSFALANRGLTDNVREFPPESSGGGLDRSAGILDAVVSGEVDLGIVYGPDAAHRAASDEVDLAIRPVRPEVDAGRTLLQLFRTWTIGVRPHDEALRDRLNVALAQRWDDVQEAIAAYGVPQSDLVRPSEGASGRPAIGVIVPAATPGRVPLVQIGEAARRGAELAETAVAQRAGLSDDDVRILFASAPTDDAAYRAAERLIETEGLVGFVGGFGEEQAEELGRIADERDVLFFNVAAIGTHLRAEACRATTFHVEASAAMYADAAIRWDAERRASRWYLVHQDDAGGERLARHLTSGAGLPGDAETVGTAAVSPGTFVYADVVDDIAASGADAVLLALPSQEQELFLAQYRAVDDPARVAVVPYPTAQTREALFRTSGPLAAFDGGARPVLWDAARDAGAEGETNEAFLSRTGRPMEPTAWAAYAAVLILHEVAARTAGDDPSQRIAYLTEEGRTFDVGKEPAVSFRPWSHQLRQPLYMIQVDPEATWSRSGRARVGLAEVVAQVPEPSEGAGALDELGVPREGVRCHLQHDDGSRP